jgi:hypothetical protein
MEAKNVIGSSGAPRFNRGAKSEGELQIVKKVESLDNFYRLF